MIFVPIKKNIWQTNYLIQLIKEHCFRQIMKSKVSRVLGYRRHLGEYCTRWSCTLFRNRQVRESGEKRVLHTLHVEDVALFVYIFFWHVRPYPDTSHFYLGFYLNFEFVAHNSTKKLYGFIAAHHILIGLLSAIHLCHLIPWRPHLISLFVEASHSTAIFGCCFP